MFSSMFSEIMIRFLSIHRKICQAEFSMDNFIVDNKYCDISSFVKENNSTVGDGHNY